MIAYRVWCVWEDDPESDSMASAAFELPVRAEMVAARCSAEHTLVVGPQTQARFVVRAEEIPRAISFKGRPDRVVMVILGWDRAPTNVTHGRWRRAVVRRWRAWWQANAELVVLVLEVVGILLWLLVLVSL